jgi:hypothetical protein
MGCMQHTRAVKLLKREQKTQNLNIPPLFLPFKISEALFLPYSSPSKKTQNTIPSSQMNPAKENNSKHNSLFSDEPRQGN